MNKALVVILAAVLLDAIGIGLIFPILPALLRDVEHRGDITSVLGIILALYAACQFLFSPALGVLSDRYGRRPVLLVSLAGAAVDYLVMAFAPQLWILVVGRAIAGITGANMAVATAYITDISTPAERARRFGLFHAMFGIGFVVGPALGGALGDLWVRAPFLAAAAFNAVNFALALFVLPETHARRREARFDLDALNPFKPLRWALTFKSLVPLMAINTIMGLVGTMYGTVWAMYCEDRFAWNRYTIGLSLGAFGVFHAGAQAFLTGPVVARLGDRRSLLLGMACELVALVALALTSQGWILFALGPMFALGGIGMPALQSLTTTQIGPEQQGQLQGVLASLASLAAVFGPLFFSQAYAALRPHDPGLIWIVGAGVYLLALPMMWGLRGQAGRSATA
ncbi:MAG: TCR/Tet family MFS transporter [Burkholderiales bacterium]|nr:TCR/Tet family MFS transporter [Burkholderiales bacterium]MDE1926736.1 TCR/Tet family MFS transporter [Burkholderiales bacterium]MDE2161130.1 TCR/Tet family MFS transporter [Burkholderiales bacterium]MDE2503324.1 TCR/Tet family MFS transporter [Burkholderiales bacterium]